jgi:hypothetical protein
MSSVGWMLGVRKVQGGRSDDRIELLASRCEKGVAKVSEGG